MQNYYVMCANFHGTYKCGVYLAECKEDAVRMAMKNRDFKNGGFSRYWIVSEDVYNKDN